MQQVKLELTDIRKAYKNLTLDSRLESAGVKKILTTKTTKHCLESTNVPKPLFSVHRNDRNTLEFGKVSGPIFLTGRSCGPQFLVLKRPEPVNRNQKKLPATFLVQQYPLDLSITYHFPAIEISAVSLSSSLSV